MKNRYTINYDNVQKFTKEVTTPVVNYCSMLDKGKSIITITGERGAIYNPYMEWKLKPNGDNTFSAYKIGGG